jgi:hypothetical protein
MTDGMKPGRGDDPFADDPDDDPDDVEDDEESIDNPESSRESQDTAARTPDVGGETHPSRDSQPELPWIYRRDTTKSDRPNQKPLFLQEATAEREADFQEELAERLGEKPDLIDVREAAMLVAMNHPELVAGKLREWGYDY